MNVLGIVGAEAAKFSSGAAQRGYQTVYEYVLTAKPKILVSGHSPLGGVDLWAEDLAKRLKLTMIIHAPTKLQWDGLGGYKERNLAIARDADLVLCVVVDALPSTYTGMRFKTCYHCKGRNPNHIKSGGCWTAWKCQQQEWIVVPQNA